MPRQFGLIAAAFTFAAILGAGSGAHAQAQSDMIPPGGYPGAGATQSAPVGAMNSRGMPSTGTTARRAQAQPVYQAPRAASPARPVSTRAAAQRPAHRGDPNGAYMGGGGVFERGADGSLRPVQ